MSDILWLVIRMIGGLLATACILRALAYRLHLSPHNPISLFVVAITDWLVKPLRKLIAPSRSNDWASLLAGFVVSLVLALLWMLLLGRTPLPGLVLLMAVVWFIDWALYLMIGLLILQAVLSWVNPHAPVAPAVNQLTTPFLEPIRKVVPLVGGVDLSPMVLLLIVYVFQGILDKVTERLAPYMM